MVKIHSLLIHPAYFELISTGEKVVEGRLNTPKYRLVEEGDHLEFVSTEDESKKITCLVCKILAYSSFQSMLEDQGLGRCLPGIATLEEGVQIYRSFPGYREGESTWGACAFLIKKITMVSP